MSKKIKFTRIFVAFALVVGVMTVSFVPSNAVEPRYVGLWELSASLSISDSGKATCGGSCKIRLGYSADLTIELEQRTGSTWETICTWTEDGAKSFFEKTVYVVSGYDYRLTVSADVYNSSGTIIESSVVNSNQVFY